MLFNKTIKYINKQKCITLSSVHLNLSKQLSELQNLCMVTECLLASPLLTDLSACIIVRDL